MRFERSCFFNKLRVISSGVSFDSRRRHYIPKAYTIFESVYSSFWPCSANQVIARHTKRMKDAICRPGNIALNGRGEDGAPLSVDDEYCYSHSAHLQALANASEKQSTDRAFIATFLDFVRRKDPSALPTIDALLATRTRVDAADWLGTTEGEFWPAAHSIGSLGQVFLGWRGRPKAAKTVQEIVCKEQGKKIRRANHYRHPHPSAGLLASTASEQTRGDSRTPRQGQRRLEQPWAEDAAANRRP